MLPRVGVVVGSRCVSSPHVSRFCFSLAARQTVAGGERASARARWGGGGGGGGQRGGGEEVLGGGGAFRAPPLEHGEAEADAAPAQPVDGERASEAVPAPGDGGGGGGGSGGGGGGGRGRADAGLGARPTRQPRESRECRERQQQLGVERLRARDAGRPAAPPGGCQLGRGVRGPGGAPAARNAPQCEPPLQRAAARADRRAAGGRADGRRHLQPPGGAGGRDRGARSRGGARRRGGRPARRRPPGVAAVCALHARSAAVQRDRRLGDDRRPAQPDAVGLPLRRGGGDRLQPASGRPRRRRRDAPGGDATVCGARRHTAPAAHPARGGRGVAPQLRAPHVETS